MGSSSSAQCCEPCGSELRLPASRLHFTSERLRALTPLLDSLVEASDARQMSSELENTLEGLVQRLVDGAGEKDPRFRCQHLIALHREKRLRSHSLEYLVPLDSLPALNSGDDECCLQEGPAGYARIRLSGRLADQWQEYLTPAGYLWRAAVVERWVGLVCAGATEARRQTPRGAARVLGVRAATAATPYEYCYLEKAGGSAGTGSGDAEYRLAIVEGATWVCVRVRAGTAEAEARLALAVRGAGGTALAAHPSRVPLAHPLALLHYGAANTGFYATAACPPAAAACPERAAAWQLWHPALEAELDARSAERGGAARVASALGAVVDHLRGGHVKPGLRVLSRYAVSCELRRRLERCCDAPTAATRAVLAAHVPHHVLAVLDRMVTLCAARRCNAYVYDTPCLARGGVRSSEADWRSDAACIANFLTQLHADTAKAEEIPTSPSETLEVVLFRRWETILREMRVAAAGAGGTPVYSSRQLLYIARVCSELVRYKKNVAQDKQSVFKTNLLNATAQNQEPVEDLIHILAIMLDQARDQYLANFKQTKQENLSSDPHQEHLSYRSKRINKLKDYYDISSACLIDAVRRDPDIRSEDLTEESNKIKHIINWLHKGMKDDKKYLGPVLKPFLEALYVSSHENCWFLDDYDAKKLKKEYQGLKLYCLGVHNGSVDPSLGLLDAAKKYAWAKALVDFIDRSKHSGAKLVFPGGEGARDARRARVRLVSRREDARARCVTLTRQDKADAKRTLVTRCVLGAFAAAFAGESAHPKIPGPIECSISSRSEEFLPSAAIGQYWRNSTKPDIITSNAPLDGTLPRNEHGKTTLTLKHETRQGRPRKERPATAYGYPDIPINISRDNSLTMRKKYHTLKSLVYSDSVENVRELRERPRSAGNSMKVKEPMSRPTILETMDFINGVREALYVEESGASDAEEGGGEDGALLREVSPLNLLARLARADSPHHTLGNVVAALLAMGKFTVLQELSTWLGEGRAGALFALHRLARAARTRTLSADRRHSRRSIERTPHDRSQSPPQRYRLRPPDYFSGDEAAPPPPPPPRPTGAPTAPSDPQTHHSRPRYPDYSPPKRHQAYDRSRPADELPPLLAPYSGGPYSGSQHSARPALRAADCTGIITPIYDERKIEKFSNKRSKSLGRSFSGRKAVLEATRYNITLGPRAGRQTNDVVAVLMGPTGETGLDYKGAYFQKYGSSGVVGDSYKLSRVAID